MSFFNSKLHKPVVEVAEGVYLFVVSDCMDDNEENRFYVVRQWTSLHPRDVETVSTFGEHTTLQSAIDWINAQ